VIRAGDEVARIRLRRARDGLADDRRRHTLRFARHVGPERRIAEFGDLDVLGGGIGATGRAAAEPCTFSPRPAASRPAGWSWPAEVDRRFSG